jgi:hypothetical protein
MSYYQPQPAKSRTVIWVGLSVVLVALLAFGAYFLGRGDGGDGGATASGGPAAPADLTAPVISWSIVGNEPVPTSPVHGPRNTEGGRAVGFTHDTLGAALAAVNIGTRLASEVGPQVYEATAREQCFGDVDSEITRIRDSVSTSPEGAAIHSEVWYKVASGDPRGDLVLISIAVKSPEATTLGGYAALDMTLRWVDGDWKMQVPLARPSIIPNVQGFTLLGRPNV